VATSNGFVDRNQFLNLAGMFQGGMVLVALALAWLLEVDPWLYVQWNVYTAWLAIAALVPLCGLSLLIDRWQVPFARKLREMWLDALGPALVQCSWWELVLLSMLVGISEELLFRGVLQMWLARWRVVGALILTNVVFAAAHALTPTYALIAGGVGLYLGCVMLLTDPPNLLIPILCHAGCDLCSFWCIRRRMEQQAGS
jgi:membrane protease YdiL (CAAX protease family)